MAYRDYYDDLTDALAALGQERAWGSHEVFAWLREHRPATLNRLRAEGYLDADDPKRTRWSWRQYLANALVRLASSGRVRLVGKTETIPDGYTATVGRWALVEADAAPKRLVSLRFTEEQTDRLREQASSLGMSLQSMVEHLVGFGVQGPASRWSASEWTSWLLKEVPAALKEVKLEVKVQAQKDLMWLSTDLALRVGMALDPGDAPWSIAALPSTLERYWGPKNARNRVAKKWKYEEGVDFSIYTHRDGHEWPLVALESEAASWHKVSPGPGNDYQWDFYKLFGRRSASAVMVARVAGTAGDRNVAGRMERLSETMGNEVYRRYRHLLFPGQPVLIVLVPGSSIGEFLVGAAVSPSPIHWRWSDGD